MNKAYPEFLLESNRIYLKGDFTFQTVGRVWSPLRKMIRSLPIQSIGIDLQNVNHTDSACLSLLLAITREVVKHGKSLHFFNIPDKMLALAKVSGVATILFNSKVLAPA